MQKILILFTILLFVACNENKTENTVETHVEATTEEMADGKKKENTVKNKKADQKPNKKVNASQFRVADDDSNLISGEFAYMADAAYFINCSTGSRFSVVMEEGFKSLEKAYLKLVGDAAGSKVYAVLEGSIKNNKKGYTGKMKGNLIVNKVISLNKEIVCNSVIKKHGGMYTYMADAGIFTDCRNKRKYEVQTTGANLALEEAYLKIANGGEKKYVEIEGYIQRIKGMEGGKSVDGFFVTRLVGFDSSYSCE